MRGQFEFVLPSPMLVWSTSTWPSQAIWRTHAPTFNIQHSTSNIRRRRLHMLTDCAMRRFGLTFWVVFINGKNRDIRKRSVTIRNEIWTTNIRSLEFHDIRECVTLWGLILRSLGCPCLWLLSLLLEELGPCQYLNRLGTLQVINL